MTYKAHHSVLERLRRGPLAVSDADTVAASVNSLKVIISNLRKAGYEIERQSVYILKSEPTEERN